MLKKYPPQLFRLIRKYASKNGIDTTLALYKILHLKTENKEKLFIDSERELFVQIGKLFSLLGLLKNQNEFSVNSVYEEYLSDSIKKIQHQLKERFIGEDRKSPMSINPDGTKSQLFQIQKWKKMRDDFYKRFNVKGQISTLKKFAKSQIEK